MNRILDYKSVDSFFRNLAEKHIDIKDYCGTSVLELVEKIDSTDGVGSPILVFFNYTCKLSGNAQRTFNSRSISFSILYPGIPLDNFQQILEAKSNAEIIGLEILSRIHVESKKPEIGWLYNNFEKDSVTYIEVDAETAGDLVGMDFNFDLKTIEPLIVTPEKWTDGGNFCVS